MKVLVYGANGWIGQQFVRLLTSRKVTWDAARARADDVKIAKAEIQSYGATHVVSLIGRTHGPGHSTIDYLEQPGKLRENVRDNLFAPVSLALTCRDLGVHFTYLGTGCIFKFDDDHPEADEGGFTEESPPNFFGSAYSTVKGFTDRLMPQLADTVLNLRIRMPITGSQNPRNFITKITTYDEICSIPNSMSVLPDLLPLIVDMMHRKTTGTVNLTNPGLMSHNEILEMFQEVVDPAFTWKNFSLKEQREILAGDRSNNRLDTTKLEAIFPQVRPVNEAVRSILEEYRETYVPRPVPPSPRAPAAEPIGQLLVTGGAGFIGSNFINMFCRENPGTRVICLDALYYCADEKNVERAIRDSPNYTFVHTNLQDYEALVELIQNAAITHVIHFAAQSHVQASFSDSRAYTQDNVVGTHNLLEACRLHDPHLRKFIHVSTDEVYGESMLGDGETSKTEQSVLCPTNPYAATKAAAELIAQSYHHSFRMPILITRSNNVYGPNQYPEKVIPRFISQLKAGSRVTIQGDGSCVRAFMHATDAARAFDVVLKRGRIGEIYNIGCDEGMEHTVLGVAERLVKLIKGPEARVEDWTEYVADRPFNDKRYYISNEKLKKLGWKQDIGFEEGIASCLPSANVNASRDPWPKDA
jgi:dTDP-glucose 4,6-dehydratase